MDDDVLKPLWYDRESGFGFARDLWEQAGRRIPLKRVQAWLAKQEARQIRKRNQYNSFVPSMPMEQIQVDLADMGTRSKNRFAFVAIDPYTKKADAVPIPNKLPGTTAKALDEALKDLGPDWPAFCLHDEGGEFEGAFSKRLPRSNRSDCARTRALSSGLFAL